MKKRIVSFLLAVCLVAGLCSVLGTQASAYSTDYPNTHVNTGDQRTDVVQIAQTQVGYAEDPGTKYGAWWQNVTGSSYNFTDAAWCVMFTHWCMDQAGCTAGYSGLSAESSSLLRQYRDGKNGNAAYAFGSGYMPRPGDLIFVGTSSTSGTYTDHVGLIVSVSGDTITTIEGNYSDKVSYSSYSLSTGRRTGSLRSIIYFGVPAYTNDTTTPGFNGPVVTEPEDPETPSTGINYTTKVTAVLNVRASASTTASVLYSLSNGTEVTIVDEADGNNGHRWGKLSSGGWICLYYTTAGDAGSGTTTTSPETPSETPTETPITSYEGTVSCDVLNVRANPGTSAVTSGTLYRGQKVTITATSTAGGLDWGKLSSGGWVATKYITRTETPAETPTTPETPPSTTVDISGTVTASVLNVRNAPGTGTVVGALYKGNTVQITETKDVDGKTWGKTSAGWISMDYVKTTGTETPTTPETPSAGTACTVTSDVVNVRSGAGTNNAVTTTVTKGTSLTIVETTTVSGSLWGRMTTGGWICLQYTSYGSGATAPETPTAPESPSGGSTSGTVTASVLNVRSTPGTGTVIGACYKGQSVTITETQTVDGTVWGKTSAGWISMDYVSTGSTGSTETGTTGSTYTVTGSVVNIRTGAGTGNPVATTVTKGTSVTIVSTATASDGTSWGQLASGGWISMDYVG